MIHEGFIPGPGSSHSITVQTDHVKVTDLVNDASAVYVKAVLDHVNGQGRAAVPGL